MRKPNFQQIVKTTHSFASKHSPEILTALGITGLLGAMVMAVKATPKALALIDREVSERKGKDEGTTRIQDIPKTLPAKDVVALTWRCYVPSAVMSTVSIACLVGASAVNIKRNAALATAYTLSETALKEYKEKVVETIGEKREVQIRDEIAKDTIDKYPVTRQEVIVTNKGNTLFLDSVTGRYFESDIEKLKKAVNELNRRMRDEMYISLNDYYYEIGLPSVSIGNDLGWNIDRGYIDLEFSAQLTEDDRPCIVIGYGIAPRYDYGSLL
jgi:hypothetical protein